jgi:hypothetical protein
MCLLSTYGSRGDVEPMVGLAVRLRALGAEVRVCAPPDKEFAELLAGVGVPLMPIGQPYRPPRQRPGRPFPPEGADNRGGPGDLDHTLGLVRLQRPHEHLGLATPTFLETALGALRRGPASSCSARGLDKRWTVKNWRALHNPMENPTNLNIS